MYITELAPARNVEDCQDLRPLLWVEQLLLQLWPADFSAEIRPPGGGQ